MRGLVMLACLAVGCSSGAPAPAPIDGTVLLHTHFPPGSSVLLGDGSRFTTQVDAQGEATFSDPSIQGPQDVTVVLPQTGGGVSVVTYLGVNRAEAWLPGGVLEEPAQKPQGSVRGKVTGFSDASRVSLRAVGLPDVLTGTASPSADGSYSLPLEGSASGPAALFALEVDAQQKPLRAGLLPSVQTDGGDVNVPDLALDHPIDRQLTYSVSGGDAFPGTASAELDFELGGWRLFSTIDAAATGSVATFDSSAPFDQISRQLSVSRGVYADYPNGTQTARVTVEPGSTSASVAFFAPDRIEAPPLGPESAPTTASASGLSLRWDVDPKAVLVRVNVLGDSGGAWTVWAPSTTSAFTPFALPSAIAANRVLAPGHYEVVVNAMGFSAPFGYEDFYGEGGRTQFDDASARQGNSVTLEGYVTLQ